MVRHGLFIGIRTASLRLWTSALRTAGTVNVGLPQEEAGLRPASMQQLTWTASSQTGSAGNRWLRGRRAGLKRRRYERLDAGCRGTAWVSLLLRGCGSIRAAEDGRAAHHEHGAVSGRVRPWTPRSRRGWDPTKLVRWLGKVGRLPVGCRNV